MKRGLWVLIALLIIPIVFADGGLIIYDEDMWRMYEEDKQFCAINYKDGFQNMILTIDTTEQLKGDKAVWIFPVPAKPDKTVINIMKEFPIFRGYDIEDRIDDSITASFMGIRALQIYPLPLDFLRMSALMRIGAKGMATGVTVHETVEKYGLTTELVSAEDSKSFVDYVASKDLEIPQMFKSILDSYIGKEYSFVVSWVSDVEEYKKTQPIPYVIKLLEEGKLNEAKKFLDSLSLDGMSMGEKRQYENMKSILDDFRYDLEKKKERISRYILWGEGNRLGVFIGFFTDKIYYPLKPTSVYGSKKVPAVIYVMDYVEPILYEGIEKGTEVNYFFQGFYDVPNELKDFFHGEMEIEDLKYTKIKVDVASKLLTKDLWIKQSVPARIEMIDFIRNNSFWWSTLVFIICSCFASLIAAAIIFRNDSPKLGDFALLGFMNILTILGFAIVSLVNKVGVKFTGVKARVGQGRKFNFVIKRILLLGLISVVIVVIGTIIAIATSHGLDSILAAGMLLVPVYIIFSLFIAPFVWAYYNDRKTMWFTILFSLVFVLLTIIFEVLLKIIF